MPIGQFKRLPEHWISEIRSGIKDSRSFVIFVFNLNGDLVYANSGRIILNYDNPQSSFLSPDFSELVNKEADDKLLVFKGMLTFSNKTYEQISLRSKVYRKDNEVLVIGEINFEQILSYNSELHDLNREISNLQRSLIKEKSLLEKTLKELKETQAMLVQSEKMNSLGQLVAGVAHEINNPIAFIYSNFYSLDKGIHDIISIVEGISSEIEDSGSTELLEKANRISEEIDLNYLKEDLPDILSSSKEGLERVKKIVEDLRNFSRLDEEDQKRVDLVENFRSTLTIIQPEIAKRGINFAFEAPDELYIECFPSRLNQVLLNMVVNSMQAVGDKGLIIVRLSEESEYVKIEVSDNGYGIPSSIKDKIFDPFFTTKEIGEGSGLGLSIVYSIIKDLHKGDITVESEKGTSFHITIPKF